MPFIRRAEPKQNCGSCCLVNSYFYHRSRVISVRACWDAPTPFLQLATRE